ncbi:MAG: hypothetical protein V3575_01235 [Candidatus Absconditabacteria bacterium]
MNKIKLLLGMIISVFFIVSQSWGISYKDWEVGQTLKINFQPPYISTPEGYLLDGGEGFGDRYNGFSYGWLDANGNPNANLGYRIVYAFNNYTIINNEYKYFRLGGDRAGDAFSFLNYENPNIGRNLINYTFNHLYNAGKITSRKLFLPNGNYNVKILNFDPQYPFTNTIKINNNNYSLNAETYIPNISITGNIIELKHSSQDVNTRINYIEITPTRLDPSTDRTMSNEELNAIIGVKGQNSIPTTTEGWRNSNNYEGDGIVKSDFLKSTSVTESGPSYSTCKNCRESGDGVKTFCEISNNTYNPNLEYCRSCNNGKRWIDTTGTNRRFGCGTNSIAPWESPNYIGELKYNNMFYEVGKHSGGLFVKDNLILSQYSDGLSLKNTNFTYNNSTSNGLNLILDKKNSENSIDLKGNIKCEKGNLIYKADNSSNSHSFSAQGKGIAISFNNGTEGNNIIWNIVCQSNTKPSNNLLLNENEVGIQANSLKSYSLSSYTPSNINNTLKSPRPADQATFTNILFHQINSIQNLIAIMQSLDIVDDDGNNLDSLFNSTTDYNNYKKWLEHFSSYGSIKHFSDSFGQTITLNDIYISNVVVHGYICSIKNKLNSLGKVSGSCATSKIILNKIDNDFIFYNFQQIIDQQKTYLNNLKDITNYYKGITSTDAYISSLINFIVTDTTNNILGYGISKNLTNYGTLLSTLSATSGGKPNLNSFFNTSMLTNYTLRGALKMAIIDKDISNITDPNIKALIITDIYTYDLSYMRGYIANLDISDLAEIIGTLKVNLLYSNFNQFLVDFSIYYNQKIDQLGINGLSTYDFMQETIKFLGDNDYLINESNKYENIIKSFNIYY